MTIYSDKLAHIQVIINCRNIDAQMGTREDGLLSHGKFEYNGSY